MTHIIPFRELLDRAQLDTALELLETKIARQPAFDVVFDCSGMTGYTPDARGRFVDWHRAHRASIGRVAIVTENTLWHMVVATMSLASGRSMRCFQSVEAALRWVSPLAP